MVKNLAKFFTPALLVIAFCFATGCNVDLLGLFVSTDLDERLQEKDNLKFLNGNDWTTLSLDTEYSFIVLTDIHIENGNASGLEKLKGVIADNNTTAGNSKIEFVAVLGDITQYGSAQDSDKFIEIAGTFGVPCYPVIGNHDIYFGNWPVWKEKIGSTCYRINSGGAATLFVLDSANAFFGKNQLDWLERELRSAQGHVFVFTHSNLFVNGPADIQQTTDIRERARIVSILQNKCDIVFMGHVHKRVINETGNVKYITIEDFKSAQIYCLVTVKNSGITYNFFKI
jgi:3',5'-cyclic AMP phosphodiesterase CpdA